MEGAGAPVQLGVQLVLPPADRVRPLQPPRVHHRAEGNRVQVARQPHRRRRARPPPDRARPDARVADGGHRVGGDHGRGKVPARHQVPARLGAVGHVGPAAAKRFNDSLEHT